MAWLIQSFTLHPSCHGFLSCIVGWLLSFFFEFSCPLSFHTPFLWWFLFRVVLIPFVLLSLLYFFVTSFFDLSFVVFIAVLSLFLYLIPPWLPFFLLALLFFVASFFPAIPFHPSLYWNSFYPFVITQLCPQQFQNGGRQPTKHESRFRTTSWLCHTQHGRRMFHNLQVATSRYNKHLYQYPSISFLSCKIITPNILLICKYP